MRNIHPKSKMDKRLHQVSRPTFDLSTIVQQTTKKNRHVKYFRKRNSHRLDSRNPFRPDPVYRILEEVMTEALDGFYYNPEESIALCIELSCKIRNKIKMLNYDRYKIVCVVEIIQKSLQDVRSVCSFLCDPKRDNYSLFKFDKFDLLAVAYVFGVYKE